VEHGTHQPNPQNTPKLAEAAAIPLAAFEPLGDLVSGDALHTNPTVAHVRTWMTVNTATAVAAGADARATGVTA